MITFKKFLTIIIALYCCVGILCFYAFAPADDTCTLTNDYTVSIHGTSNIHNWDEKVGTVSGKGTVNKGSNGNYDLASVSIIIDVHSIKSTEGSGMDNNTYKALKADTYPQITFVLTAPLNSLQSTSTPVFAKGNLTIAGVTKAISLVVNISMPVDGKLTFQGSQNILMSDYNVTPPTALFGTIKAGNLITLNFKTNFSITAN
jgi:polyisoprenoid-binding protein YceI